MSVSLRLPRMLADTAGVERRLAVNGSSVVSVLSALFEAHPGLRNHIVDESGEIRPHVSVFVDGHQASLETDVGENSDIVVLQAVSGG